MSRLGPLILLSVACSASRSPESFCAEYVDALDARSLRCSGGGAHQFRPLLQFADFCGDYRRAITAKTATFDSARAQACLDALLTGVCDLSRPPATCRDAFAGAGTVGAACHADFECGSGLFCGAVLGQPCPGQCRAYARLTEDCSGTTACLPELSCDASSSTLTCIATSALGEPCAGTTGKLCARPLFCAGGTCAALKTSGACTTNIECDLRYRCAGAAGAKSCVARKKKGEACVDGQRECETGLSCNPSAGGTCTEPVALGAACTLAMGSSDGVPCAEGFCDTGTLICTAFKPPGASCTAFSFECGLVLCGSDGKCPASGGVCHVP